MKTWLVILSLVLVSLSCLNAKKGIVVLDDLNLQTTHSIFFAQLSKTHELSFFEATDPELKLADHGEYMYDFGVFFCPHTEEFGGELDEDELLNFIDAGHHCIIAADDTISDPLREIALECGVEFGDDKSFVIDHHNFDVSDFDFDHTKIVSSALLDATIITGELSAPVLFRGIDQKLENDNALLLPILSGSSTSYGYFPDDPIGKQRPHSLGQETVLISTLQARNNARVLFSGSLEFFGNEFLEASVQVNNDDTMYDKSGNEELIDSLCGWVLQERGVLRATEFKHYHTETKEGGIYTVKEKMTIEVVIEEWNGGKWVPYVADDVQMEFAMIDPYYRTTLKGDDKGKFSTEITVPDVYGIYTLRINYNKFGFTSLALREQVTVRPLRHNQFERFIPAAFPYYASAFSMMAGVVVFGAAFLYTK